MWLKHFSVLILMVLMLAVVGCSKMDASVLHSEVPPVKAVVVINDIEYQMDRGNYYWEVKKGFQTAVATTDHASPNQMAEYIEPINAEPNQKVEIQIEDNPKIELFLWNKNGKEKELELNNNEFILPTSKRKYIYEAVAEWSEGTISYTFVVEIK